MKKSVVVSLCSLSTLLAVQTANADLIDAWDFYNLPATTSTTATPSTIAATLGTGVIDVSAFSLGSPQGTSPEVTAFTGDAIDNAFPGSDTTTAAPTQMALSIANMSANGKSVIFNFSMLRETSLVLSFATRGTSTGFDTHAWAYSTDGISYTPLISNAANKTSTWSVETVDFGSVLDNVASAYVSLTLSGATSSAGNNRLDNIQLNASPVPEPSTLALAGLGGLSLMLLRRLRK